MQIKYLSTDDQARFSDMIHTGGELATLFGALMLMLETDSDYDTVLVSFEDDDIIRVAVEDSPYIIILDEQQQQTALQQSHHEDWLDVSEDDFTEEALENIVDIIDSRILGEEYHAS